jgi:hypothetical protein
MNRPINIFFDFLKNLKDLVVSVKIGSAKATPHGAVLAQLSDSKFKVEDEDGNTGVCTLVAKHTKELDDNEMSIWAFCTNTNAFLFIKKIIDEIMIDYDNIKHSWEVDHDSTQNIVLLRAV